MNKSGDRPQFSPVNRNIMSLEVIQEIERFSPLQRPQEVQIMPALGENSRLDGTGFILPLEIKRLFKNYNQNLQLGKSAEEAWMLSVGELVVNVRTFTVEYIQSSTVLPHKNRIEAVNGINTMVGANGVAVIEGIADQERQGGVKDASVAVDNFISAKAPNRVAVINSPLGHSGIFREDGSGITYKNNQTMVFWTNEQGELHGLTLVTDLKEEQAKALSVSLGVDEGLLTGQTQLERVSSIVRNPALFSHAAGLRNPAEYVLDQIIAIRGNTDIKLIQDDGTVEIRSVDQTRADIKRVNQLLSFSEEVEDYISNLKNSLLKRLNNLNHPIVQLEITRQIEETILKITIEHLQKIPNKYFYRYSFAPNNSGVNFEQNKFILAAAFLRTRAGCAGSSSRSSLRGSSLGSGGIREGLGGACGECGMPKDGHYHCPDCKERFEDESNKTQSEWTKACGCGFKFGCAPSGESKEGSEELPKAA